MTRQKYASGRRRASSPASDLNVQILNALRDARQRHSSPERRHNSTASGAADVEMKNIFLRGVQKREEKYV